MWLIPLAAPSWWKRNQERNVLFTIILFPPFLLSDLLWIFTSIYGESVCVTQLSFLCCVLSEGLLLSHHREILSHIIKSKCLFVSFSKGSTGLCRLIVPGGDNIKLGLLHEYYKAICLHFCGCICCYFTDSLLFFFFKFCWWSFFPSL